VEQDVAPDPTDVCFFGADGIVFDTQRVTDVIEQFSGFGLFGRHSSLLAVAGSNVMVYTGGGVQIVML
jgi:hypothetical protein